jgi:hypothetical protein
MFVSIILVFQTQQPMGESTEKKCPVPEHGCFVRLEFPFIRPDLLGQE